MAPKYVAGADGGTLDCMGRLMTEKKDLPAGGYFVMPRVVSFALLFGVAAWIFGGIWYAAKLDSRVASLEQKAALMETAASDRLQERDRLTIVEQQVKAIRENQERQSTVLDRIERRLGTWQSRSD